MAEMCDRLIIFGNDYIVSTTAKRPRNKSYVIPFVVRTLTKKMY